MTKRLLAMLSLTATIALGLAACGSDSGSSDAASGGSGGTDPSTIKVASTSLGDVLVDGSGRTLYLFTHDGDGTASMDCDAACKKQWPSVNGQPKAGDGVDASLIGTTKSGSQATYAGHPLYYYAGDTASGDVNGQGVNQIWYVLDGKGSAVKKTAKSDSGYSGGY